MSSLSRAANLCLFSWFIVLSGVKANIFQNQDSNSWYQDGVRLIQQNLKIKPNTRTARNAVVFLGDGMGVTTVTAARILAGQLKGNPGEETVLSWEQFPWSALAKTYAADLQGTDSASSMTAILCGVKTNEDILGVDERVKKDDCSSLKEENKAISILALAENAGMSTGIVTTTRVTHATPASAYAHSANRGWEADADFGSSANAPGFNCKDIASQLVDFPYGNGIEVIFGGGRRKFLHQGQADPEYPGKKGERLDRKDLIQQWLDKHNNSRYVWNQAQFDQIDPEKVDHVIGLFEYSHMKYEVNRLNDTAGEPSIEEMTEKAIKILQKNPKGFFLLVEGGRIDHGHHAGRAVTALHDAVAMDKAVAKTKQIVDREETLITVTADHSHVFTIGGYPKRGNPVFGLIKKVDNQHALDLDGKPYTTLGYANGRGGLNGTRPNITNVDTADKKYRQQATVLLRSETHGSEDVGIFADGPGAYLFHGVVEQQYIFHVLDHALCLSQSKQNSCHRLGDRRQMDINSAANEKLSISSMFAGILLLRVLQFLWT
ncbi:alkaline phosphatase-like [Acropora millepora]|uniref:alkaline phosphatase-like n=1 Tax=Acropora millepora TaxID=45264 RepID=UPI001CF5C78C|nr:alkaline phosphatase-like [Acropora millepora]